MADHLALGVSQSKLLEPCARIVYADRCNRIPWLREQGVEYDALLESVKTGYRELIRSALTVLEVG